MVTVLEYLDREGSSPFAAWFGGLDATAAAKVTTSVRRIELGNLSNVKGLGIGLFEYRLYFGPGYRLYFGKGRRHRGHLACRRNEEAPGATRRQGARALGCLQGANVAGAVNMALRHVSYETAGTAKRCCGKASNVCWRGTSTRGRPSCASWCSQTDIDHSLRN